MVACIILAGRLKIWFRSDVVPGSSSEKAATKFTDSQPRFCSKWIEPRGNIVACPG